VTLSIETIGGKRAMTTIVCPSHKFTKGELEEKDDFFIIEMHCYNMILGTKWLQKYRDVCTNFKEKWVEVNHRGRKIGILGTPK